MGALIIILSLGFDVFAQQVLDTQRLDVASDNTHLAQNSGAYLPRNLAYEGQWLPAGVGEMTESLDMRHH